MLIVRGLSIESRSSTICIDLSVHKQSHIYIYSTLFKIQEENQIEEAKK